MRDEPLRPRWLADHTGQVIVAALAALVALSVVLLSHRTQPLRIDGQTTGLLYGHLGDRRHRLSAVFVDLGSPRGVLVEAALVAVAAWCLGRRLRELAVLLTCLVTAVEVEVFLKPLIGRQSPPHSSAFLFPSGHVAGVTSVALAGWLLLAGGRSATARQVLGGAVVVALVLVVGVAVIILQFHFLTDALGGALVALITTLVLATLVDRSRIPARR
ncbi:MAG: phosphatase PAP2 family protein [Acidimicrobiales bacterium]